MDDALLTCSQVAWLLGLSPERVRQLTLDGRLPCRSTPHGRLYDPAEVARFTATRSSRSSTRPGGAR